MTLRPHAWLLAGTLVWAAGAPVRAHGIQSSLERLAPLSDGQRFAGRPTSRLGLQLESRFSSGMPASDALVKLVPPDGGQPVEVGRTDGDGRLTFSLPAGARPDWELQVDAGPGHRDYLELPLAPGAPQPQAHAPLGRFRFLQAAAPLAAIALLGCVYAAPAWRRRRP